MRTLLLVLLLTTTLAPLAAADITIDNCNTSGECQPGTTIPAPGPNCAINPPHPGRNPPVLQC
jgi:hypothetical protein